MAGRRVFAEVEHLLATDELHPDDIHLPGVFVDDVLLASGMPPKQPTIARFLP
jgi:3-oxoacid CoA-transferase subunit A